MKSLTSPKTSSSLHRASQSLSGNPFTQEPSSKLTTSKLNSLKPSELADRSHMSNSPIPQHHALRDLSNLVGESLLYANLGSAGDTPSDMSLANVFNDGPQTSGGSHRRAADEVTVLRRELEQKNHMIDKLMKENLNLRKEMEEFLSTVDEAREYIDIELKECNNRIQELEAEIQEVRAENQVYKQQLSKQALELASDKRRTNTVVEDDVENYYGQAKKDMEDFHFRLNEQIINFMEISKNQYQEFNKIIQNKISNPKNEKVMTCPASPKRDNMTPSLSANKASGPKPVRNRNSSMSISAKNPRSPSKIMKTPVTPKTPKSFALENRNHSNKTPKSSADVSNNKSIDLKSGSLSSTSRVKGGYSSSHFEADVENHGFVLSSVDLNGQRNPTSHALSPKSSLLRAKLKSDMILQEMRRKLGEGFGQI